MPLTDTGDRVGTNARAKDGLGATVVVSTTDEAVQDYGWGSIFDVASNKYDAGHIEPGSNPPMVRVVTSDFNA